MTLTQEKTQAVSCNEGCAAPENAQVANAAKETREVFVRPRYQIESGDAAYMVSLDVPGAERSGANVSFEDGVLEISARREAEALEGWKPLGLPAAEAYTYRLRLAVSDDINPEGIAAQLEHGVLRLSLPKAAQKQPRRIAIG